MQRRSRSRIDLGGGLRACIGLGGGLRVGIGLGGGLGMSTGGGLMRVLKIIPNESN